MEYNNGVHGLQGLPSNPMNAPVSNTLAPNLTNLNPSLPLAGMMPHPGAMPGFPLPPHLLGAGMPGMLPPRFPFMPGGLPGLPPGFPGMPMPGAAGLSFQPQRLFPGFPGAGGARPHLAAANTGSSNTTTGLDPNNDITCWTEHSSEEGRKYWYNSVTFISTYEKPFCLKTPEERSIPPCTWKEYTADGKVYYSNGKEST
jgi:hypothetical protein